MVENYNYILNHWDSYKLTDTRQDFISLVNCLEAIGESIDSLHNTVLNGDNEFWDVIGGHWENDRELVDTVFYFCSFLTVEELKGFLYEELADCKASFDNDGEEYFYEIYFEDKNPDTQIIKTTDGYVKVIHV